jgi:hypothetical protein
MKEEWLMPGATVPVDPETTAALVAEIKRLIGVVGDVALNAFEPRSSMAWQEGHEAGRMTERMHVQAFMRQMFDAYSLSSVPGKLLDRGKK